MWKTQSNIRFPDGFLQSQSTWNLLESGASCWFWLILIPASGFKWRLNLTSAPTYRHRKTHARSWIQRVHVTLTESVQLWTITAYELLLWVRTSALARCFTALLPFLHWPQTDCTCLWTQSPLHNSTPKYSRHLWFKCLLWFHFYKKKWINSTIKVRWLSIRVTSCLQMIVQPSWGPFSNRTCFYMTTIEWLCWEVNTGF